ncbi:MAG: glycosyltransferase family 4 protein [Oculatellaceae cyanobacterium Prado106]|nr:glycosyltransferase family 4 protein [Oculatellaceae cyanobacterium Prado106]
MNVLHINQFDAVGGAAIAAYRLHQGLLRQSVNSRLLVGQAKLDSPWVNEIPKRAWLDKQIERVTYRLGLQSIHITTTGSITQHPFYQAADILNFHNLHTGYFNYLAIGQLTQNKPAVLTLHDMWSFTGHCSYSNGCDRWTTGCGQCPHLDTHPQVRRDNTHLEWRLKDWVYSRSSLTIVAPSQWLAEQAKRSILQRFPIYQIPNGLDTKVYQPLDSAQCRAVLGIPASKRVLLFSAESLKEKRKGGDLLQAALQKLPDALKSEILLLTLGEGGEAIAQHLDLEILSLGYVSCDRLKALIYSAADLFVLPTRADNLPLVLQESMACGTPMVSFKVGGVPDLVRPGVTGYLATAEDTEDLCQGIVQLLEDRTLRQQMQQNCREIAIAEYSLDHQAKQYQQLYQSILKSGHFRVSVRQEQVVSRS